MRRRFAVLITGLAVAGLVASAPATARPIDKGHFHDVFTSDIYDCDGTPAQDSGDVSGNFVFNQRGSSPFPYFRESVRGTVVTTNLETGGTFTYLSISQQVEYADSVHLGTHVEQQADCARQACDVLGIDRLVMVGLPDQRLDTLSLLDVITPITSGRSVGRLVRRSSRLRRYRDTPGRRYASATVVAAHNEPAA